MLDCECDCDNSEADWEVPRLKDVASGSVVEDDSVSEQVPERVVVEADGK